MLQTRSFFTGASTVFYGQKRAKVLATKFAERYILKNNYSFSSRYLNTFTRMTQEQILKRIKSFIPPLTYEQHKGQSGRIGIIGGSEEYTGAPYFAAISALKVGADLVHVFCTKAAAQVIKSYSPELIVHPILDDKDVVQKMQEWIPRLHSVAIGPGLGRDPDTLRTVLIILEELKKQNKPLVIDADGVFMITKNPEVVKGYSNIILTPNAVEFKRLCEALDCTQGTDQSDLEFTSSVSKTLGGPVIARKLRYDIISDGENVLEVQSKGCPRRCGGQGDLLSGSTAVFLYWELNYTSVMAGTKVDCSEYSPGVLSAYAACLLSKLCAEAAFEKLGRSTTTSDLINEIHFVFDKYFENYIHK